MIQPVSAGPCEIPIRDGVGHVKLGAAENSCGGFVFIRLVDGGPFSQIEGVSAFREERMWRLDFKTSGIKFLSTLAILPDNDPSKLHRTTTPPSPRHQRYNITAVLISRPPQPDNHCCPSANLQASVLVFHRVESFLAKAVVVVDKRR